MTIVTRSLVIVVENHGVSNARHSRWELISSRLCDVLAFTFCKLF